MSSEFPVENSQHDVEKGHLAPPEGAIAPNGPVADGPDHDDDESTLSDTKLSLLARRVEKLTGIEERGIRRVTEREKTAKTTLSFIQIVLLWLSINTAAQNITLASIGQSVYGLGFLDAALCSALGGILGSIPAAYTATWGPISGNRTLVGRAVSYIRSIADYFQIFARFSMGWWPTKLCVLLNLVILLGYSMIDAVVAGQMLSAVSPDGSLTVVVGIIIVAIITWVVTTFGIRVFHYYERLVSQPH